MEDYHTLNLNGKLFVLNRPKVMGILNVTPNSFYDGGRYMREKPLLLRLEQMLGDGADIIDVGGYSSRPGAEDISVGEEKKRVSRAIGSILEFFPNTIISVDTFRSEVAAMAAGMGALMINDISGGQQDENMLKVVAGLHIPYIMMHMRGTPQSMQSHTNYQDIILTLLDYFATRMAVYKQLGGKDLIIDPGFGFAKSLLHNYDLLEGLSIFKRLNAPILVGVSRKSMIYKKLGITAAEALNGTTALNTFALCKGANILRVHDVKEACQIIELFFE